ncbi:MAG: hypothetical protein ACRES4_06005, partial [Nevskiales bacterium]
MKLAPPTRVSNWLSLSAGLIVAALGLVVIVGWHRQDLALTQLHAWWGPMPYDAALGLFLCGVGLAAASLGSWRIALGGSLASIALAAFALIGYLFRGDLPVDGLWMPGFLAELDDGAWQMHPNTAGALFLSALMLLSISFGQLQKVEGYTFANMLGLLVALFGLLSLMTYFSTLDLDSDSQQLTVIAPHAALGFTLLGFSGAIFRWPEDAEENVDIARLQNLVITYVSAGVLVAMLFSVAIGLIPIYELLQNDPLYEVARPLNGSGSDISLSSHERLGNSLRRQVALTGIASLLLAY